MAQTTHDSGTYLYLCNGENAGISEDWELHRHGAELHIESVRHVPATGLSLRVRSVQKNGQFRHCILHWLQRKRDFTVDVSADYCFDDEGLTCFVHNGEAETGQRIVGHDFLFSPLMRIYNGPIIEQLCDRGHEHQILVPWIKAADQRDRLLHPQFSTRRARYIAAAEIAVDGADTPCRQYEYSGGEYQPGTRFWVDDRGIMLRYHWRQDQGTEWDIRLSTCQRD